ncbi:nuclear polyadenylated RNA-binding protein-like protein Nab2 [Lentithecium fluviatile CBS 122367]|uniref:Nuclear polyadenylated RNA-binding protein-like protein Nab2 n=1 Tax=Lentithecium fluviatile CBS 122367 TaxID=1168545 RepID=A0A6G1IEI3_9PLEO|nr:nuclear polyadenylated RNA-binding protein-like protein Nab2 [Lentithecium fluviatile CBS 122367]
MAVDFANGSPLANALQNIVQAKLTELGWLTSDDDTTLFDYILLMLANEKNEAQVASELSNDLLDLGPDHPETQQFARWLFAQIDQLRTQLVGGNVVQANTNQDLVNDTSNDASVPAQDTEMEGVAESSPGNIPTGPKAMRNGSGAKQQPSRRGGMISQLNKQMNRTDDSALHRVRGSQGVGRINSHSREPPKGPRQNQNLGRGLEAMANGRGMGNANIGHAGMNGMNMGGMPMPPMGQGMPPGMPGGMPGGMPPAGGVLTPQQQMALMQMYEQQAHMMQQIFSGQTPAPYVNPNFQSNRGGKKPSGPGRGSLQGNKQGLTPSAKFTKKEGQDEAMADGPAAENGDGMEVETSRPDPATTMCNFNQRCSKPDCPFVHSSPAAPRGTVVDMNDTCSYGVACKNKKCVGKHPSPAQRQQFQAEQECAFYPNCRDPTNCPYKHPSMPACRNGADCTTPGCKFWHSSVMCKYTPCTNPRCPYKHAEGQKQAPKGNVWVAPKNGEEEQKQHVSERKFIDETQPEELIIPDKNTVMEEATL